MFLLLIIQAVSAQDDIQDDSWLREWETTTDVDVIDDTVTVSLRKFTSEVETLFSSDDVLRLAILEISCMETLGSPRVMVSFMDESLEPPNVFEGTIVNEIPVEVTYRVGTNEAATHEWSPMAINVAVYRTPYVDDDSGFIGTEDASLLVEMLVQDNSRFIVRAGSFTAIWNIEGLAEVIGECMTTFD